MTSFMAAQADLATCIKVTCIQVTYIQVTVFFTLGVRLASKKRKSKKPETATYCNASEISVQLILHQEHIRAGG